MASRGSFSSKLAVSISLLLVLFLNQFCLARFRVENVQDAVQYLENYGYLGHHNNETQPTEEECRDAFIKFQKFLNIKTTGLLDVKTMEYMNKPRCGIQDSVDGQTRKRRFALKGTKWPYTDLTYRVGSFTSDLTQAQVLDEIERAFQVWEIVTVLNFTRITSGTPDIWIEFKQNDHGDGYPFDGVFGTLAHAFYPTSSPQDSYDGDAHFDDAETWTVDTDAGINFFQVAAHEFGHSLGLSHSNVPGSVMWPTYEAYNPDFELHQDDVDGIQLLYGDEEGNDPDPAPLPPKPCFRRRGC